MHVDSEYDIVNNMKIIFDIFTIKSKQITNFEETWFQR